ncbi:Translocon at the outer membrane of chloroplasts 64 [Vigna angularis]|uniref:Translocon at the outer membrane of chloroplasts 64 n=1 Tax=Phaseolus angularis TaxID=3914 RepID=A0A8T0JTV3_PHAAN|nr:Translocon at the outer membrane of chloroplasts 64 [Vigna angularis]
MVPVKPKLGKMLNLGTIFKCLDPIMAVVAGLSVKDRLVTPSDKKYGNQAYKDRQWQKAIGFYTEAIKLCSDNATYYSNRAQAYLEHGSYLQVEADCTKAISLDKNVSSLKKTLCMNFVIVVFQKLVFIPNMILTEACLHHRKHQLKVESNGQKSTNNDLLGILLESNCILKCQ